MNELDPHFNEACETVRSLLRLMGENAYRSGLEETPARVVRSWSELYSGYKFKKEDVANLLKEFDSDYNEMVILRNIDFVSTCEHHLMTFSGVAHIGYIPSKKVVGISKLARLLEVYSRRLQIQERITSQVTEALMTHLKPQGAGCVLIAKHGCINCRGVDKQSAEMITSSLEGCFRDKEITRSEFLKLIGV